jgi:hypothetical protein
VKEKREVIGCAHTSAKEERDGEGGYSLRGGVGRSVRIPGKIQMKIDFQISNEFRFWLDLRISTR